MEPQTPSVGPFRGEDGLDERKCSYPSEEIAEIADNLLRAPPTSPLRALLRSLAGIAAPAPVAAAG